jgi:NTE family protein
VPKIPQVVDTLLFGAGARITHTTLAMMSDDVQRWKREIEAQRGSLDSPFSADAQLHVISVGLHDVDDEALRHSILTVPTAFTISEEHVARLLEAGRQALRRSPEFERLRVSLQGTRRPSADAVVPSVAPTASGHPFVK